jgi:hypothetical protein
MSFMKKLSYSAATIALLAAAPAAVHAQQTSAQLRGVVIDGSGNPVSGATVTVTHVPTGATARTVTSANGTYFETGLRVGGPYTVSVAAEGFDVASREGLSLSAGQPEVFNVVLGGNNVESIVVLGSAVQSTLNLNGGVGSVYSASDLAAQPSINRDVISSIAGDPLVTLGALDGRGRQTGTISIAGQPPRFNGFVIDGLAQQNDFGLDQGLFPTLRQPISIDWIQETSVQVSDYSVLANGFTGGLVNVVTRSGTNEFDGSAYYYFFDDSMVGDRAFDRDVTNSFSENEWGVNLGGPIVEDRAFFFVGFETVENTVPLNFDRQGVSDQVFSEISSVMNSVYNYDPGSLANSDIVEESTKWMGNFDFVLNEDHRLSVSYQHSEDSVLTNQSAFSFPTNFYVLSSNQDFYKAELTSNWTDNFSTIIRVARKEYTRGQDSLGDTSATGTSFGEFIIETDSSDPYWAANGLDGAALLGGTASREFRLGPDVFRHHNAFNDERNQYYFQGDYSMGDHLITFGAQYEQYELFNVFGQYSRGQYEFSSIQDLEDQVARISYINAFSNDSNDVIAAWGYDQLSLFAQDNWQVTPKLNVNYGIRYDRIYQDDVPPAPEPVIDASNPDQLLTFEQVYGFSGQDNLDGLDLIQPRFGFTYDYSDRLTLSGGVGIYSGGNPQVWISNNYTGATGSFFGYSATGVTGSSVPAALQAIIAGGIQPATLNTTTNRRAFNAVQNIDIMDPNFEIPYVTRASLSADYNLNLSQWGLGDDYRVTASIVYGKQNETLIWRNLAFERADLQSSVGVAPDGRVIYPDLGDIPDPADPTNSRREFNVPDAFMITTTEGGENLALAFQVAKDYDNGFGFDFSYAYQDVDDLIAYASSRAVSSWRGIVGTDRNNPIVSTSSNETEHKFALRLTYERDFIADLESSFTVFGVVQSGSPFSYGYNVGSSNPIFGRANGGSPYDGNDLLYIPEMSGGAFNDSRVVFETAQDEADFLSFVQQRGLERFAGSILPRNVDRSPWTQRWDFRFQQELPGISAFNRWVGDNRAIFVLDIENFPNLLNDEWGQVVTGPRFGSLSTAELGMEHAGTDGVFGTPDDRMLFNNETGEMCQTATSCRYVYSNIANPDWVYNENRNVSVYRVRVGIRYEF